MGLTERHWFENEEPELTDRQLEDIAYENEKAYNSGYVKGFHDAKTLVVRCKECKHFYKEEKAMIANQYCRNLHRAVTNDWFCADGVRRDE